MGYITYAAGTLIVAVVIHSLWSKRKRDETVGKQQQRNTATAPIVSISEPSEHVYVSKDVGDGNVPSIGWAGSRDDAEEDIPSERSDSPPQRATGELGGGVLDRVRTEDSCSTESSQPTRPALTRVQSQEMPPPPRVSSAPNLARAASQARGRAVVPPQSSLPPSRGRSPSRLQSATAASLTPAPRPAPGGFIKPTGFTSTSSTLTAPSTASALRIPQQKVLQNTHMQPALSTSTQAPSSRSRNRVTLAPGHSPLDWASLTRSTSPSAATRLRGSDASGLLGPFRMGRIPPSLLKAQNGRKGRDAWTSYQGRVYNISAYLDFHPGGRAEILRGAGRASDALFAEMHPWVNWDGMLASCCVGMLVGEDDEAALGKEGQTEMQTDLDEMD